MVNVKRIIFLLFLTNSSFDAEIGFYQLALVSEVFFALKPPCLEWYLFRPLTSRDRNLRVVVLRVSWTRHSVFLR